MEVITNFSDRFVRIASSLTRGFSSARSSLAGSFRSAKSASGIKRQPSSSRINTEFDEERLRKKAKEEMAHEEERYVQERYSFGKQLGKGHFSVVRLAVDRITRRKVAIKCIVKAGLTFKDHEGLIQEIDILRTIKHPNIIKLYAHYETRDSHFLVTELASGGELFDRIVDKDHYSEYDAKRAVRCITKALAYCHHKGIVHRDLKPENILLKSPNDDTDIKIADFGFAKLEKEGLNTALGTPGYIAPEILQGYSQYTAAVDIWSLGVIAYILLCGYPPFHANTKILLYERIKLGHFKFHEEYWDSVSFLAKDLIKRMLVVNPMKRFTIDHVLCHPWLAHSDPIKENEEKGIDITPAVERLKQYQAKRRWKASQRVAQAVVRMMKPDSSRVLISKALSSRSSLLSKSISSRGSSRNERNLKHRNDRREEE